MDEEGIISPANLPDTNLSSQQSYKVESTSVDSLRTWGRDSMCSLVTALGHESSLHPISISPYVSMYVSKVGFFRTDLETETHV